MASGISKIHLSEIEAGEHRLYFYAQFKDSITSSTARDATVQGVKNELLSFCIDLPVTSSVGCVTPYIDSYDVVTSNATYKHKLTIDYVAEVAKTAIIRSLTITDR